MTLDQLCLRDKTVVVLKTPICHLRSSKGTMYRTLTIVSARCTCKDILLKESRNFSNAANEIVVPVSQVKRFVEQCSATVGIKHSHAQKIADCMIEADLRGHYSHGLNRIG